MTPDRAARLAPIGARGALVPLSGRQGLHPLAAPTGGGAVPTLGGGLDSAAPPDGAVLRTAGQAHSTAVSPGGIVERGSRVNKHTVATETCQAAEDAEDFYGGLRRRVNVPPDDDAEMRRRLRLVVHRAARDADAVRRGVRMIRRHVELPRDDAA
jgi:hypothetical protein